jgi:hypothetical protein
MTDSETNKNLPAQIAEAISGIPKALVPGTFKALDRLVSATIDIPVAWLGQQKAKIDAQTESYKVVEGAIAKTAALEASGDQETVRRAVGTLVRKEYRKQVNREAVATAMIEDLRSQPEQAQPTESQNQHPLPDIDEDWLNIFERYAEDASTERMQKLWGRVLAGEVRKPGRYAMRTLRFLSEFSQADAITFSDFANSAFTDIAPANLVKPENETDIRQLIYLESSGIVQGSSGLGLQSIIIFDDVGNAVLREGNLMILFKGEPGASVNCKVVALTPLGQELLSLLPGRDVRFSARNVANAMRSPVIKSAYLCHVEGSTGKILPMEVLWQEDKPIT